MKKKATKPRDVMYANWVLKSLMSRETLQQQICTIMNESGSATQSKNEIRNLDSFHEEGQTCGLHSLYLLKHDIFAC
jgi:hypothetical protein